MSTTFRSILTVVVLLAAGCSSTDGRVLSPPDVTTTLPTVDPIPVPEDADPTALLLLSPDFGDYEELPTQFTTEGEGAIPELFWENLPEDTQEVAIVVTDPINNTAVHWAVWGLDPTLGAIGATLPADAKESANYLGEQGWAPPVREDGVMHTYVFTLYALDQPLALEPGGDPQEAVSQIAMAATRSAELVGLLI
ncbi:MAG: YbhB/YbcL family Raf kinase inhibitor-like protein [Acidimicrobiales bacterium]